ncbi:pentapeptide repeat-containing protein [Peptoniphilus faecalis]|nr:pentapeptide repeat-containing protein [Peptoniphilus faecalis]
MDKEKLQEILRKHELWLNGDAKGERANLRCANLADADLKDANLADADLRHASLRNADLRCANLADADLKDVNLADADLSYANLKNAKLNWCNTQDIIGQKIISVQVDTTRKNNQISYWVNLDIWTTGCFQGSLDELKKSIEETHKDNEFLRDRYYRAIDFILNEAEQDKLIEIED